MTIKWPMDMMRTDNSLAENSWMKNSWPKQASGEIPVALNKMILSMVANDEMNSSRSEKASMERKWYTGSCRNVSFYEKEKGAICQDGNDVHGANVCGDPNVMFYPWNPKERECTNIHFMGIKHWQCRDVRESGCGSQKSLSAIA